MDTSFLEYDDLNYSFHFFKSKTKHQKLSTFWTEPKTSTLWLKVHIGSIWHYCVDHNKLKNCGNKDLEVLTSIMRKELSFEHKEIWINLRNLIGKNYSHLRKKELNSCIKLQAQSTHTLIMPEGSEGDSYNTIITRLHPGILLLTP